MPRLYAEKLGLRAGGLRSSGSNRLSPAQRISTGSHVSCRPHVSGAAKKPRFLWNLGSTATYMSQPRSLLVAAATAGTAGRFAVPMSVTAAMLSTLAVVCLIQVLQVGRVS